MLTSIDWGLAALVAAVLVLAVTILATMKKVALRVDELIVGVSTVALWLYGVGSAWVQLQVNGRQSLLIGAPQQLREVTLLRTLCMFAAMAAAVLLVAKNYRRPVSRPVADLAIYALPFVVLTLIVVYTESQLGLGVLMFLLFGASVWMSDVRLSALAVTGWLTIITAAIALAMGLFDPAQGLTVRGTASSDEKAIIGTTLLSGPFASPNTLGLLLALGLPLVWVIDRRSVRMLGSIIVVVALVWTASRTSLAGAVLAAVCLALCLRGHRAVAAAVAAVGAVITVVLPLVTTGASEYTGRGRIWTGSLQAWSENRLLGAGADFYQNLYLYRNTLGGTAFHGHNVFITFLTVGGVATVAGLAVLFVAVFRRSIQLSREGNSIPLAWLTAFFVTATLESSLDLRSPGYLAWITWPVLALVLLTTTGRAAEESEPSGSAQAAESPVTM